MKSLRQLQDELVNLRLTAIDNSLWELKTTLREKTRSAVNDGVAIYESKLRQTYTSLVLTGTPQIIAIPRDIGRVISINVVGATNEVSRKITDWQHRPTAHTNLLQINARSHNAWPYVAVEPTLAHLDYEPAFRELPADLATLSALTPTALGPVGVTGGSPGSTWRAPGYFELSFPSTSTIHPVREVVRYNTVTSTTFDLLERGIEGVQIDWAAGAIISAVYEAPENAMPVIMARAQASMYEFWVRHKATYDQYQALAGEQALTLQDLLTVSRAFEDKADRSHSRIKRPPAPAQARVRVRRP